MVEGFTVMVKFKLFELDQSSYGDGDCLSTLRVKFCIGYQALHIFYPFCSQVYDGFDESSNEVLAKCGTSLPRTIISTSNVLYIKLDVSAFEIHVSVNCTFPSQNLLSVSNGLICQP